MIVVPFAVGPELGFPFVPMEWVSFGVALVFTLVLLFVASYLLIVDREVVMALVFYGVGLIAYAAFYWTALFPLIISQTSLARVPGGMNAWSPAVQSSGAVWIGVAFIVAAVIVAVIKSLRERRVAEAVTEPTKPNM
jgi:hypothetical protein